MRIDGSCHSRAAAAQVQTLDSTTADPGLARQTRDHRWQTLASVNERRVDEMAVQRAMAVTAAFLIESVLILAVVFSSIGIAPGARPTPAGAMAMPAPAASH
jgi:hypothetical protein